MGYKEEFRMIKEKYEHTELEVIEFIAADILTYSNPDDEYEGEIAVVGLPRF